MTLSSRVGGKEASPCCASIARHDLLHKREVGLLGRRTSVSIFFWLLLNVLFASWGTGAESEVSTELPDGVYAEIGTPRGVMVAELFFQRVPLIAANFVGLAEGHLGPRVGVPYYDGLTFHRVVPGFVVQGGDPAGTGEGGPGYSLPDEFDPALTHDTAGILSMANDGPNTNGSQFFITLAEAQRLNFLHSVFGKIIRGADVISRIQKGDQMTVAIRRVGRAAEEFQVDRTLLDTLAKAIPAPALSEPAPFFEDPDGLLPTTPQRAKSFGYQLANLARFTDTRVFARIFSSLTKQRGPSRAEVVRTLSTELGTDRQGILAVYWADDDTWDIALGEEDVPRFQASMGPRPTEDGVRQILTAAGRRTADSVQLLEKEKVLLSAGQLIKLKIDDVLHGLITAMKPKRKTPHP